LKGDVTLGDTVVDGILKLDNVGVCNDKVVDDKKYNTFVAVDTESTNTPEYLRIRGYDIQ